MNNFFENFGTHAIAEIGMGAKYVTTSTFSKKYRAGENASNRDIQFSAEASYWGVGAKPS